MLSVLGMKVNHLKHGTMFITPVLSSRPFCHLLRPCTEHSSGNAEMSGRPELLRKVEDLYSSARKGSASVEGMESAP